jgi:hypothetical protein
VPYGNHTFGAPSGSRVSSTATMSIITDAVTTWTEQFLVAAQHHPEAV